MKIEAVKALAVKFSFGNKHYWVFTVDLQHGDDHIHMPGDEGVRIIVSKSFAQRRGL